MQDFYLGGYTLLVPTKRSDYMNKELVPENFYTISWCHSSVLLTGVSILVDGVGYAGFRKTQEYKDHYNNVAKLNDNEIVELEKDLTKHYKNGKFGSDAFFTDKSSALDIYTKYFKHLNGVKLISIGLSEAEYKNFCEWERVVSFNCFFGIYECLVNKTKITEGTLLGFEVVGREHNGGFHNMFCTGADTEIHKKFRYTLNNYGLLDNYEDAEKSAICICEENIGEPLDYYAFALFEHELE